MTTRAPSATNNRASAAPCPRAPPLMSMTLPLRRSILSSICLQNVGYFRDEYHVMAVAARRAQSYLAGRRASRRLQTVPRYFSIPSIIVGAVAFRNEGSELNAARAVVDPVPAGLDELAGRNHRRVAKDGYQIAMSTRLYPQYAELFSSLWNVTRSTRPTRTSVAALVPASCATVEI